MPITITVELSRVRVDSLAGHRRSSAESLPVQVGPARMAAAIPHTQRAPRAFVTTPAATIPAPSDTAVELISTVNVRPRSSSGAPRCTRSALQTTVEPFPAPETTTHTAATHTLGETAARAVPTAI